MDDQVVRSLMKWPNVPDCFGWLALDRRGQWRMRDKFSQHNHLPGQVIHHPVLNDYIARNYASDEFGRYFFKNGPQRVFINLEATPWIARIIPNGPSIQLVTQCHNAIEPDMALSDENGNIYIVGNIEQSIDDKCSDANQNIQFIKKQSRAIALLHDHDLDQFSELAMLREEACSFGGFWNWQGNQLPLEPALSKELADRFHYQRTPQP